MLSSCVGNRKITAAKNKLNGIEQQMQMETVEIKAINTKSDTKLQINKIDSNILRIIGGRLAKSAAMLDSAELKANLLKDILKDKKRTRENYRSIVLPVLDSLQKQSDKYAERLLLYFMVKDGLDVADFKLFELAAFFGPGIYEIPEDKVDIAAVKFTPLIDSLMEFSYKYNKVPRTATLIILGYADGEGISSGSELYYRLLDSLGKPRAEKEELNQKLSEFRAKELIKRLTDIYIKKAPEFKEADKLKIRYIAQGKGEALPFRSIKDYNVVDDRRRIVLCYWVVLPD